MMQQAADFLAESRALEALLDRLEDAAFETATGFKGWTLNNVIRHLHVWNYAADLALTDEAAFEAFYSRVGTDVAGGGLKGFEDRWLERWWRSGATSSRPWRRGSEPRIRRGASSGRVPA